MSSQNETEIQSEIKNRIAILQEAAKFASVNSSGTLSNFRDREETALDSAGGDFTVLSNNALKAMRSLVSQAVDSNLARQILDPLFANYAKVIGIPELDAPSVLRRLYKYFIDNSKLVKSRNITFGSVSAGSNLGSGTINRLTVDAYGYDIESCHMEAKRAECIQDQNTGGSEHEEIFRFRGANREIDQIRIAGSGTLVDVAALSSIKSIITNPSFSQFGGDITAPDEISGWTVGSDIANFQIDRTNFYRPFGGRSDTTPSALMFEASDYVQQDFDVNGVRLSPDVPVYAQLAYNRAVGSATGTLIFTMGEVSVSVTLAAQTGWNILRIPLNKMLYPRNFAGLASSVPVKIQFIRTGGTLLVDDLCIAPMVLVDGLWYQVVGGATPFVAGLRDSFSWTDALAGTDSIIQQWLWRAYGLHLPHSKVGGETWTDPSV